MKDHIEQTFSEHIEIAKKTAGLLSDKVNEVSELITDCIKKGNKI